MTPSEYVALAMRTKNDLGFKGDLIHAALLIGSEAGELISEIKRDFAYGKPLHRDNIIAEAGDCLWAVALICHTLEVPMEEVMRLNIAKLEARYPDLCFNPKHAVEQRDKGGA